MKNKFLIIIIAFIVFSTTFFLSFIKVDVDQNINGNKSNELKYNLNNTIQNIYDNDNLYQTMSEKIYISNNSKKITLTKYIVNDLPDEFSWKDYNGYDYTTEAKNQGNCGSCWLFGAVGALESVIKIQEDCPLLNPDLSEQYILSCMPEAGSCNGGNSHNCAFHYIMNTSEEGNYRNGITLEEYFSYDSTFSNMPSCTEKKIGWNKTLVPISNYSDSWNILPDKETITILKSLIYQYGPIYTLYYVSDYFQNWGKFHHKSTDYYKDIDEETPGYANHGISIVGWKDDPSINNGGYWIIKNSWDTDWGYDGFFNLEYDCLNIGLWLAWVEYDPNSYDWNPIADAGGFYKASIGEEIIFDASNSIDPDGEIISYNWNFNGDNIVDDIVASYSYNEPGIYCVKLTVTDNKNQTSSYTSLVGIENDPIDIKIYGGNGATVEIINPTASKLTNITLSIDITCSLINMDCRNEYIDEGIPAFGEYSLHLPLIGFGVGNIKISLENFEIIKKLLIIGPFVIII